MQPVTLSGTVTPFAGNGRQFGYPTANITTQTDLADGVYFGYADLAGFSARPALIFIGVPVTVGDTERRVEVHVLDIPDVDHYNQPLRVSVQNFHRGNKKFDSVSELLDEMKADEQAARAWFTSQQA
jgi:riboflavin kinase/FMN adenylyltransferase